jgi:hypothetical protein
MLVTLPLDDVDENAAIVNALQLRPAVIVQKGARASPALSGESPNSPATGGGSRGYRRQQVRTEPAQRRPASAERSSADP